MDVGSWSPPTTGGLPWSLQVLWAGEAEGRLPWLGPLQPLWVVSCPRQPGVEERQTQVGRGQWDPGSAGTLCKRGRVGLLGGLTVTEALGSAGGGLERSS